MITMYTQPRMIKFCTSPYLATRICISGPAIRLAKPKPMIAKTGGKAAVVGKPFDQRRNRGDITGPKTDTADNAVKKI